jgi:cell division protein FtsZ
VAELAAEAGALVIAFVSLPFSFEGSRRLKQADEALRALRGACDAVIPLPNDLLLQEAGENEPVADAFARADAWIGRGVKSIWSILSMTGLINLDMAALRQVFQQRGGRTLFALGRGAGALATGDVVASLKSCPLLQTAESSRKADRLLVNIVGGRGLALARVNEIMGAVAEQFGRDAEIAVGAVIDDAMGEGVEVCVIGSSDVGGRAAAGRRPRARPAAEAAANQAVGPAEGRASEPPSPPAGPAGGRAPDLAGASAGLQEELAFGEIESRGHFEKTDRNLHDGYDLDVPTYLRKGIRIVL